MQKLCQIIYKDINIIFFTLKNIICKIDTQTAFCTKVQRLKFRIVSVYNDIIYDENLYPDL